MTHPSGSAAAFRMRLYRGGQIAIGPGRIALLEAIQETGSISAAARTLNMSYRRAWLLVNETNKSLKQPAVISTEGGASGGGSELTRIGLELIERYRRIEREAVRATETDVDALKRLLVP